MKFKKIKFTMYPQTVLSPTTVACKMIRTILKTGRNNNKNICRLQSLLLWKIGRNSVLNLRYIHNCMDPKTSKYKLMTAVETVSIKHFDIPWSIQTSKKVTFGGQYVMCGLCIFAKFLFLFFGKTLEKKFQFFYIIILVLKNKQNRT